MLQMNREDGWTVIGVFDGHGMWGGKVASAVRDGMVRAMKDVDGRKMNGSDPEMVQISILQPLSSCQHYCGLQHLPDLQLLLIPFLQS